MAGVLGREAERAAGNDQAVAVLGAIEGSVNHEAWTRCEFGDRYQ